MWMGTENPTENCQHTLAATFFHGRSASAESSFTRVGGRWSVALGSGVSSCCFQFDVRRLETLRELRASARLGGSVKAAGVAPASPRQNKPKMVSVKTEVSQDWLSEVLLSPRWESDKVAVTSTYFHNALGSQ